ncbi:MAG: excinuclease ABC subunit UvrC [Candidatus Krumholzibacteria bacterium]|nr:excinuclease ABC subunit UvrC [Candidatus Krumholzibacteria bacterium]
MTQKSLESRIRNQISHLPLEPGVYMFKDAKGQIIYVGKAKKLRTRVRSYLREGGDGRHHIQFLVQRVRDLDYIITGTEQEALILENNLIKKHRPRYNIFFKDDKTYVHVKLNADHPFPRLTIVRTPGKDKARYFGPYASAGSVRATLRMLGKIFPMRTCNDSELTSRKRPCLYYYIKRCPAPCVGYVDPQGYKDVAHKVTMFMKGRGDELVKALKDKMDLQAAERQYEAAARTRDQLYAVQQTLEKQRISTPKEARRDVFGVHRDREKMVIQSLLVEDGKMTGGDSYYFDNASLTTSEHLSSFLSQYYQSGRLIPGQILVSDDVEGKGALEEYLRGRREGSVKVCRPRRGELKRLVELAVKNAKHALEERGVAGLSHELLEELRDILELKTYPRRIECFDVSNFQGRQAVASQVTFIDGESAKAFYRHYRVRTLQGANDYGMMKEVLERRIARGIKENALPDLLLVDGGRGQLNVALDVVDRLGADDLDVLAIAKVREGHGRRKAPDRERIYSPLLDQPLLLEGNSQALYLLQRIRDEAHRFAINYHKKLRSKQLEKSILDSIPGVGPVLKRRLLRAFGSIDGLMCASEAELTAIQGVSRSVAARVKEFLDLRA